MHIYLPQGGKMSETKKKNTIEKIKKILKKTGKTLMFTFGKESTITEDIAKKIQQNSFDNSQKTDKQLNTPIYILVAEQLQASQEQIFQSATNALFNMVAANPKLKSEILFIFEDYINIQSTPPERIEYINSTIKRLKQI